MDAIKGVVEIAGQLQQDAMEAVAEMDERGKGYEPMYYAGYVEALAHLIQLISVPTEGGE